MAELDLKQIEDRLNKEFSSEYRKIVFWYDDNGDYEDEVETLILHNARLYKLKPNNLFQTKVLLERLDTVNSYLIYAPFPKPISRENHLADTIKYSVNFTADRATSIAMDLGINHRFVSIFKKYNKFFNSKERKNKFYSYKENIYNEATIEIAMLSALTNLKASNFEDVVKTVLTKSELKDNEYLVEFAKYNLDVAFWKYVGRTFGFIQEEPNLEKFVISLFLTYGEKQIKGELPKSINDFLLSKSGTVITFMDQLMNNVLYREEFDLLSHNTYEKIKGEELFKDLSIEYIADIDVFEFADKRIIKWAVERLLDENINENIDGMDIPAFCSYREKKHFGKKYSNEYRVLKYAFMIVSQADYKAEPDIISIVKKYTKEDYKIDSFYRKFYYYFEKVKEQYIFEELRELVENIYTNRFLDNIIYEFNKNFSYESIRGKFKLQRSFYNRYIEGSKDMMVVIISDGLRYEVAKELAEEMEKDKKFEKVDIEPMIGVIPSYTRLGMASLLPYKEITINDDYNVFVDGIPCSNLVEREKILKMTVKDSACIQYDDLKRMKKDELRDFFVGKPLVYIYHNQIDNRGENAEDEIPLACNEAIEEIKELITRLTDSVSRTRFLITADHGFIYKRDKAVESDKINSFFTKEDMINKRFILSDKGYEVTGTRNLLVADVLDSYDTRVITVPIASNIFKTQGGSQNYVHGGSSPQEILIPIISVKTVLGFKESKDVRIILISIINKISSLILNLDFVQQDPISDVINPVTYKISFVDEKGAVISNEEIYEANSKEKETAKRIFKLKFNFKNQKYKRDKKYYLVALDVSTGMETLRHEVIMDIAFADDFGFDL